MQISLFADHKVKFYCMENIRCVISKEHTTIPELLDYCVLDAVHTLWEKLEDFVNFLWRKFVRSLQGSFSLSIFTRIESNGTEHSLYLARNKIYNGVVGP